MAAEFDRQNSNEEIIAGLEAEVEWLRSQLHQAEQDGAEIATRASEAIADLQAKVFQRQQRIAGLNFCDKCEESSHETYLYQALFYGLLLYVNFFSTHYYVPFLCVISLAFCLGCTYVSCRWRWRQFKRRFEWFSPTDNRIYRALQAHWNSMVKLLIIK